MSALTVAALAATAAEINTEHEAAQAHAKRAVEHAIRAGELLLDAKAALPHGAFGPWLTANFAFSDRTARGYMRLAGLDEAKRQRVADMSLRRALGEIAEPRLDILALFDLDLAHSLEAVVEDAVVWSTYKEMKARGDLDEVDPMDMGAFLAARIHGPRRAIEIMPAESLERARRVEMLIRARIADTLLAREERELLAGSAAP